MLLCRYSSRLYLVDNRSIIISVSVPRGNDADLKDAYKQVQAHARDAKRNHCSSPWTCVVICPDLGYQLLSGRRVFPELLYISPLPEIRHGYSSLFRHTANRWDRLRILILAVGWGLMNVFGLALRGSTIGFHLLWHTVELPWVLVFVYDSDEFDLICFRFDALTEQGAFIGAEFLCISVLRVASGPRMKLAGRKSALTPAPNAGDLFYWPFYGGGPGVSLTLCCFVVYSTRRFVLSCLVLFCYCIFQSF